MPPRRVPAAGRRCAGVVSDYLKKKKKEKSETAFLLFPEFFLAYGSERYRSASPNLAFLPPVPRGRQ